MSDRLSLIQRYRTALRQEPKLRSYLGASVVDDVGVAISGWASMLLMTNLFTDQRERAKLAIPSLGCFIVGSLLSGPIADWTGKSLSQLATFRYRVVLWARLVETVMLAGLVFILSRGNVTIARVLPYVMVSAFMKTSLGPARQAFEVDLLRTEAPQLGPDGAPLLDERGQRRMYKVHLLSFGGLTGSLRLFAALGGLLVGGRMMTLVGQRSWLLFAADVVTNLGFIAILALGCHPTKRASEVTFSTWVRDSSAEAIRAPDASIAPAVAPTIGARSTVRRLVASMGEGARFLAQPAQRPLVALLSGCWIVEVVNETYNGSMIVKHLLHGSDDAVRYGVLGYTLVSALGAAFVPAIAGNVGSLGKLFLLTMLVDGVVIAIAGRIAGAESPGAIRPFVAMLCLDSLLTLTACSLAGLAQNSATSGAMRGRVAAIYTLAVLLGDLGAEVVATKLADSIGIPAMMVRVGLAQVAMMGAIVALVGRRLWVFGLRVADNEPALALVSDASVPAPLLHARGSSVAMKGAESLEGGVVTLPDH